MNSNLNILALNIRGIECHGKLEQTKDLLNKYHASVGILSETETTHKYAATTNIEGFRAFCPPETVKGPPGKEVGVIMLVSNKLASAAIKRPDINGKDSVQTVWTELRDCNLLVGGVYRRNRPSDPELEREEIDQLINQVLKAVQTGKPVLLLGDLNLDHLNPEHKKKIEANDLLSAISAASMRHLPTGITWKSDGLYKNCKCVVQPSDVKKVPEKKCPDMPTLAACGCPKGHRTGTIDNAYISNTEDASAMVLSDALSDHFPIMVCLKHKVPEKKSKLETIWRRDIKRMAASEFEDALQEQDWSQLYQTNDPNEVVDKIVKNIQMSLDKVAPLIPISFRPDKPKISLKRDTLEAMASRDASRRSGNRTNFKVLRNKVNRLVKRDKIRGVLSRLKKNPGSQQAWIEANTILGRGRGNKLPSCTNNKDPVNTANHQNNFFIEKVDKLVASLPSGCQNDADDEKISKCQDESEDEKIFSEKQHKIQEKSFEFKFVTAGDVTRIIRNLNNTKAEGVDNIPTDVLKKGVTILAGPIARLCNISLSTGVFPDLFKQALVHPVHKGGGKDPREPGSYRPISILPALSKVLEIVVRDPLLDWLEQKGVLPESQFGFRPNRSVAMALACAQADWVAEKSKGNCVGVMAFDLSAAFDTISAAPLIEKLKDAGVKGTPLEWLTSYMTGRSQSVIWNGVKSTSLPLTHGVAQGSILGPLLFLVMVADLPDYVTKGCDNAKMCCYADDSTLSVCAKTKESLKAELERLSKRMIEYCNKTGLIMNSGKTQLLISSKEKFEVNVGESVIESVSEICLLGIDFDTNFSTAPYLQKLATEAKTRAAVIYRLSFSVPSTVLKILANGLVIGKIMAAAPAAIPFKISQDDRAANLATGQINRAIKSVARTITKTSLKDMVSSESVLKKAGLRNLNEMVASSAAVMVWKSKQSRDPLGCCLFPKRSSVRPTRSKNAHKATQPVPGNKTLAANLMARCWNNATELHEVKTLGEAKTTARKWASNLLKS